MIDFIKDADCTKETPVKLGVPDAPIYGKGMVNLLLGFQGTVNFGGKATDTAMVTISTDFNETIRADMDAKAASGVVQVDFIEIKTT